MEAQAYLHKVAVANCEGYELDTHTETDAGHGRIEVHHYTQVAITDWVSEASKWKEKTIQFRLWNIGIALNNAYPDTPVSGYLRFFLNVNMKLIYIIRDLLIWLPISIR